MSAVAELDAAAWRRRPDPRPRGAQGAWAVLRRGISESPELRRGLGFTVIVSLGVTVTSLVTPVLIQKVFDNGFDGRVPPDVRVLDLRRRDPAGGAGVRGRAGGRTASRHRGRGALMELRVRTFAHIHDLSIAEQSEEKRGVFVARVTADVDALQQFMEWGGIAWIISIDPGDRRARADARLRLAARPRGGVAGDPAAARRGRDAGASSRPRSTRRAPAWARCSRRSRSP